ncbi:hypothetical protein ABT294_08120 [Nonomuraea sp. NPDC000554]|uniref:hypothetical protein n=1 Tax=Nonomuraea sp. NPDC000554 TaxID=3154259 RepID=UPI003331DDB7
MIAYVLLAITTSLERGTTTHTDIELVPISCRELVKLLRRFTLPRPGKTSIPNMPCTGPYGDAATYAGQWPATGGGTRLRRLPSRDY